MSVAVTRQPARAARGEVDIDLSVFVDPEVVKKLDWKRLLKTMGPNEVMDAVGPDWFVSQLTADQRRELKKLLQ